MNEVQKRIKELMEEREKICFQMVEAKPKEHKRLALELEAIEQEIEIGSGRTIEEVETQYQLGDN